jgi:hypothetical protein
MVTRYHRGDKMLRVTFEDGNIIDYKDDDVIEIENYPARDTPKPGWQRTREYPPEYRRATPLRIGVLAVGHCVSTGSGFLKVARIERV